MNYISAILLLEIVGFLSIFFLLLILQAFKSNEDMGNFIENNLEHGISLKVILLTFAIMGILLTHYGFINIRW